MWIDSSPTPALNQQSPATTWCTTPANENGASEAFCCIVEDAGVDTFDYFRFPPLSNSSDEESYCHRQH